MHEHGFLQIALVFLTAAVIGVPLFRRLGLGAVLGYLVAGVAIGPHVLGLVPHPDSILAASEFGVVLLLFVIGLELSPARLWVMRRHVLGFGSAQVFGSTLLIGIGLWFAFDWGWRAALIISLGLALSSTAVGLQMLAERKELTTAYGRIAFSVLLFQDIIAIPLLAAIPLMATGSGADASGPDWILVTRAVVTIAAVIAIGPWFLRHLFRGVARTNLVEVFTATALLVVMGTAWIMQSIGLSMGLGAFLAGVLLADSEFRHELESHIEPFKGLFLGLFFIAVGMSIDLQVVAREPHIIAAGVVGLLLIKMVVLFVVGRSAGLEGRAAVQLSVVLGMGGEFAFVVFAESFKVGLLEAVLRDRLVVIVGLSMAATPLLMLMTGSWLASGRRTAPAREPDVIDEQYPRVIIGGFGRMGQIIARMLTASRIPFTALEHSAEQVDFSRRFGSKIYFGDPARPELLRAAHAERAEVFVVTTDDPNANLRSVRVIKRLFPHLKIIARARNRQHAFKLMDLGVEVVMRETFHSALEMGRHVLEALGTDPEQAARNQQQFREHDEKLLLEQHLVYDDDAALVASARDALRELETLFDADTRPDPQGKPAQAE